MKFEQVNFKIDMNNEFSVMVKKLSIDLSRLHFKINNSFHGNHNYNK